MQLLLHASAQRTGTGQTDGYTEPDFKVRSLWINVSQISVNLLGSITIKVQHSENGSEWTDVPNLTTGGLSSTGKTTISLDPSFATLDNLRIVWTFNNANSITFTAIILGAK